MALRNIETNKKIKSNYEINRLFSLLRGNLNRMFPWKSLSIDNNSFCIFRVYQKESNLIGYML